MNARALAIVFAVVASAPARVRAEPADGAPARAKDEVPIVLGGVDPVDPITTSITDVLATQGTESIQPLFSGVPAIAPRDVLEPPPRFDPVLARVWIDVRKDAVVVSIADRSWERIFVRRIRTPEGLDPVTREEVAHVVASALETLREGGTIGIARTELVRKEPPPPSIEVPTPRAVPPRAVPETIGLQLGVGYEGIAFGARFVHGPAALLRGSLPLGGGWRAGLAVSVQSRSTVVVEPEPIGVHLGSVAFRSAFEIERRLGSRFVLRAGLGPGVDVLSVEPRLREAATPNVGVSDPSTRTSPILRASIGVDARVLGTARIFAVAVLDHDLDNRAYALREGAVERSVLDPPALRPGAMLGIAADVLGP